MSSETGWQSTAPFNGPYGLCKHAIESYSDALRRELRFRGVKVIKIQPWGFNTDLVAGLEATFQKAIADSTHFTEMVTRHMHLAVAEVSKARDPVLVARTIHKALTAPRPKAAYSVKPDPLRSFLSFLPTRLADALIFHALKD
jgi:NAD(P)-dependent dehydrogenase (short-subunit alcohol dehydrogenase family)